MSAITYNTGETEDDLRKEYNPEGSTLRMAQYRMLEMLLFIRKVCSEQNIEWCLEGGNVLGAVRHGGFIPWDDDADIIMRRRDYRKFIDYMETNPSDRFVLQTKKTDPGYYGSWVVLRDLKSEYVKDSLQHKKKKYRGLQVDIFPIEEGSFKLFYAISNRLHNFNMQTFVGKNDLLANLFFLFEQGVVCKLFRVISRFLGDKRYFSYEYGHGHWKRFSLNSCFPTSMILFEDEYFPGPNNPDDYLKCLYKNYMDLPAKDQRNCHQADYKIWN